MDYLKSEEALVSIICASYNEEAYLEELLKSIIKQTYKNIEMIFVDDGSTDNTKIIIDKYQSLFEFAGKKLIYIYQENQGQAAATNKALKYIKGDYLSWIDGDDYLFDNAVEKKVDFLEKHKEYSIVASDFFLLYADENNIVKRKGEIYGELNYQSNQFYLALFGESIIENLAQMIRVKDFKKINNAMEISKCAEGQNFQMLLPMLYYFKRGYIDEPLGCYRIHSDSHCHKIRSYKNQIERYDALMLMLKEVLETLNFSEKEIEKLIKNSTFNLEKGNYIDYVRSIKMVRK